MPSFLPIAREILKRDAGTELRKALGISEPAHLTHPEYRNPGYHGGFHNAEDERDFAEKERLWDAGNGDD